MDVYQGSIFGVVRGIFEFFIFSQDMALKYSFTIFRKNYFFFAIFPLKNKFKNSSDDPKSIPLIHIPASSIFGLGCRGGA